MTKVKEVLKIALPAVGEMMLYMLVWVVDTAFVGNYGGKSAVSSVGLTTEIIYTIVNILITVGLSVGITTTVAQSIGAGNKERAEKFISQGLIIGITIAFILLCFFNLFANPILNFGGLKGNNLINAVTFMKIVSIGVFFNILTNILNAGLRGSGNTMIPFAISIIINLVLIPLDYILIFGKFGAPVLGIKGSAIATTVAYIAGFVFLVIYYLKFSKFKIRIKYIREIKPGYMKKIVRLGIPSGLQEGAFSISRLLTIYFVLKALGEAAFAANQVTTTIESISFMPGWGFAVAATALVGQQVGAKNYKKAKEYAFISMFFGIGVMIICAVIFILIPGTLMRLFLTSSDTETIKLGITCLMIASIEQPFMAISMVFGGALKGAGDTKTPFLLSVISSWGIRIPLMFVIIYILKLGVGFVWAITGVQWIFEGTLMYILFKKKSNAWGGSASITEEMK